jgi:hypothetical protein
VQRRSTDDERLVVPSAAALATLPYYEGWTERRLRAESAKLCPASDPPAKAKRRA